MLALKVSRTKPGGGMPGVVWGGAGQATINQCRARRGNQRNDRAIFKKIDELRGRRHLATDEGARRAITDHIDVLVKKLNGPEPLLRQEVLALLDGESLTEIPA